MQGYGKEQWAAAMDGSHQTIQPWVKERSIAGQVAAANTLGSAEALGAVGGVTTHTTSSIASNPVSLGLGIAGFRGSLVPKGSTAADVSSTPRAKEIILGTAPSEIAAEVSPVIGGKVEDEVSRLVVERLLPKPKA